MVQDFPGPSKIRGNNSLMTSNEPRKTIAFGLALLKHSLVRCASPSKLNFVFSRRKNNFVRSRTFSHSETVEKRGIERKKTRREKPLLELNFSSLRSVFSR